MLSETLRRQRRKKGGDWKKEGIRRGLICVRLRFLLLYLLHMLLLLCLHCV